MRRGSFFVTRHFGDLKRDVSPGPYDMWTEVNGGAGDAITSVPARAVLELTTAAGTNTSQLSTTTYGMNTNAGDRYRVAFNKAMTIEFEVSLSRSEAAVSCWLALKAGTTLGALGEKGIGIKIVNLALSGECHDGTTLSTVALGQSLTNARPRTIGIVSDGAGNIMWFVDGVFAISSAGGPKVIDTASTNWVLSITNNGTTLGATTDLEFSPIRCIQGI